MKFIIRLNDGERDYFLEWSTVVEAPTTIGLDEGEMRALLLKEGIEDLKKEIAERMKRAKDKKANSGHYGTTLDKIIRFNRAGNQDKCLTKEELIETYCRKKEDPRG